MSSDSPPEGPSGGDSAGWSRPRIKSLMVGIAVLAVGLGWLAEVVRDERSLRTDQAVFASWIDEVERAHAPNLATANVSVRSSSNLLEMGRRCDGFFQTRAGRPIRIQADLRIGPLSSARRVTIHANGRVVTWPFEDIERGRKLDLEAEFPGAFR